MEDLVRSGLAEEADHVGSGFMIQCSLPFYVHFDPLFMNWNADRDAMALARELSKRGQERVDRLSQELGWSPRQINPAVFRLLQGDFADESNEVPGTSPFYRVALYADNQIFQGRGESLDATRDFRCSTPASGLHG